MERTRLPLGRVDLVFGCISIAVLCIAVVFGYLHMRRTSEEVQLIARNEKQLGLQALSQFVVPDLQAGHFRYVWKQLEHAYQVGAIHCFALLDSGKQPIVDDPEVQRRCPKGFFDDPTALPENWISSTLEFQSGLFGSGQLFIASKSKSETSGQEELASATVTLLAVFLLCLVALIGVIRLFVGRLSKNLRVLVNEILEGREPSIPEQSFMTFPEIESIAEIGRELARAKQDLVLKSQSEAVARMTQMLAHDVRKPFSSVQLTLELLRTTPPERIREVVRTCVPEIEQSLASVNGMIEDVMQVGSDVNLHQESVSFSSLLRSSLVEMSRVYPDTDVDFEYRFESSRSLFVDTRKTGRVFSNIIGNAYQAMSYRGKMWFELRDEDVGWCEIVIGNGGSFIPAESAEKLFDAFFTSGKKDGTGLGLAIAKKIVEAHGGSISCRSEKTESQPDGFVEFVMRLPLSEESLEATERLESNSREILTNQRRSVQTVSQVEDKLESDAATSELAHELAENLRKTGEDLCVWVVEDEAIYRNHLESLLDPFPQVARHIRLRSFSKATNEVFSDFFEANLVILDVDLGRGEMNGLEVSKRLRESNYRGDICIHSNRYPGDDAREAFDAGADAVFPKPMSQAHFLKLLRTSAGTSQTRSRVEASQKLLRIAHVDDQLIVRLMWKSRFSQSAHVELESFESPEDFLAGDPSRFDGVFTDFHFAPLSAVSGLELAQKISERAPGVPVFLTSNGDFSGPEFEQAFAGILKKDAPEESEIRNLLSQVGTERTRQV